MKTVQISGPSTDYQYGSSSAVVQGKLHIFGGLTDRKKIARLDECDLVELTVKLNFDVYFGSAALSISDNSEALICFDYNGSYKLCERFTGTGLVSTHATTYNHGYGSLGLYNGHATTVGSYSDGARKTEAMTEDGWTVLADHQKNLYGHSLVGLKNGDLLMLGGVDIDNSYAIVESIWRLSNNVWTEEGNLQHKVTYGSAILNGESIYYFSGYDLDSVNAIQRIDLTDNAITGHETIGNHDATYYFAALFKTNEDFCVGAVRSAPRQSAPLQSAPNRPTPAYPGF